MPKVIQKYVLQQKIGSGQFGDVFKGHHQDTHQLVAIKSIKRETIKGKFYELLQNEIKVLKTCDNPHIIKLYSLKKTPNNYYLMLEYCNQGDMLAKIRKEGKLSELQVIKYISQILNAFQTLVKHKIMHRDFKLANILLHEDNIKIADFGFAKLLTAEDYATTMLGSPLNMAPQVLGGTKYNSKADIWSIGACIYEMIYGKPPFIASNMVDLAKLIKAKPVSFPPEIKTHDLLKDLLKKMLVPDVKRRISWSELFSHPITTYLDKMRVKEVDLELAEDESLMMNTSKYYLKNNLIINKPEELQKKSQVNEYLLQVIRTGKKKNPQEASIQKSQVKQQNILNMSKVEKQNSKRLLQVRNIYAFLANLADQILNSIQNIHYDAAAYVLTRKIIEMITGLKKLFESDECNLPGVQLWSDYKQQAGFKQIKDHINNEYQVFKVFNNSLEPTIKKKCLQGRYDQDLREMIIGGFSQLIYKKYLKAFIMPLVKHQTLKMIKEKQFSHKQTWKMIYYSLKVIDISHTFGTAEKEFNFKQFYDEFDHLDNQGILLEIEQQLLWNKQ